MKQFTDFLEKNVEWLALGLGGIFLLWMVWAYVITPPVSARVGGQELALGEVDRHILRGPAAQLRAAIEQPGKTNLDFPQVAENFRIALARQDQQQPSTLPRYATAFGGSSGPDIGPEGPAVQQVWVTELATLPAPVAATRLEDGNEPTQLIAKGVSEALVPLPDPADGAAAPGDRPLQPRVVNVNREGGNVQKADRLWATLLYTIDMQALVKELTDKKYYTVLNNQPVTAFLAIEVERQELVGPDQWSDPVPVRRLPMNQLLAMPDGSDPVEALQYVDWAAQNTLFILKPPFYPTVGGVQWFQPGFVAPVIPAEAQPSQPGQMTPEEYRIWKAQDDERRRQERDARRSRSTGETERPGRRPRRGREEDFAPRDLDRPGSQLDGQVQFHQVRPDPRRQPVRPIRPIEPTMFDDPEMMDPEMMEPAAPIDRPEAVIPQAVMGKFVPDANTPNVEFWFHDETLEAGKTYRYRVRYTMLNPIYNMFNSARPENLQQVFTLVSPWSAWSKPVVMDALSQYYVSGSAPRPDNAAFDVFKWEGGGWHQFRFDNVRPGDMIGGEKTVFGQPMDFTTGATVVDIRESGPNRDRVVIVMDSQGNLITRDFRTDQNDATRRELQQKADQNRQRLQEQARTGEGPAAGVR